MTGISAPPTSLTSVLTAIASLAEDISEISAGKSYMLKRMEDVVATIEGDDLAEEQTILNVTNAKLHYFMIVQENNETDPKDVTITITTTEGDRSTTISLGSGDMKILAYTNNAIADIALEADSTPTTVSALYSWIADILLSLNDGMHEIEDPLLTIKVKLDSVAGTNQSISCVILYSVYAEMTV